MECIEGSDCVCSGGYLTFSGAGLDEPTYCVETCDDEIIKTYNTKNKTIYLDKIKQGCVSVCSSKYYNEITRQCINTDEECSANVYRKTIQILC